VASKTCSITTRAEECFAIPVRKRCALLASGEKSVAKSMFFGAAWAPAQAIFIELSRGKSVPTDANIFRQFVSATL
jgi:hypothetical protein